MRIFSCLIIGSFVLLIACKTTKNQMDQTAKSQSVQEEALEFGCYEAKDTIDRLILYFPEEKHYFLNGFQSTKEDLCQSVVYDISQNKGVMYYYEPESNFMYMMSIIRQVKACYLEAIDALSMEAFGATYEELSPEQKSSIDEKLSYRVLSE